MRMRDEALKGEKIVLIENEFGEIGIDGGFLKEAGIEISEMNSGCICCSLVGDFGEALGKVMEQFHPDRILSWSQGVVTMGALSFFSRRRAAAASSFSGLSFWVRLRRTAPAYWIWFS